FPVWDVRDLLDRTLRHPRARRGGLRGNSGVEVVEPDTETERQPANRPPVLREGADVGSHLADRLVRSVADRHGVRRAAEEAKGGDILVELRALVVIAELPVHPCLEIVRAGRI